jgi:hypothetical protein
MRVSHISFLGLWRITVVAKSMTVMSHTQHISHQARYHLKAVLRLFYVCWRQYCLDCSQVKKESLHIDKSKQLGIYSWFYIRYSMTYGQGNSKLCSSFYRPWATWRLSVVAMRCVLVDWLDNAQKCHSDLHWMLYLMTHLVKKKMMQYICQGSIHHQHHVAYRRVRGMESKKSEAWPSTN